MHKTPSARYAGTSPKSDDSNPESFCRHFIVGFGGGRRGSGVVATEGSVESLPLAAKRLGDFVRGRNSIPFGGSAFEPREAGLAV